jgi:putative ABC transport system substrate-binding protein
MVVDPVGQRLVESLSNPGRNITGFTHFEFAMSGKWLQLLKEIAPDVTKVGVLFNPETAPYYKSFLEATEVAALSASIRLTEVPARNAAELERALLGFAQESHGGLLVLPDTFTTVNRVLITALAARHKLPSVYPLNQFIEHGGLMSYGPDLVDLYRRSAYYVDRVLNGVRPSDLPVQQPTKFKLTINLKAAKEHGREIPPMLLARADEVIE